VKEQENLVSKEQKNSAFTYSFGTKKSGWFISTADSLEITFHRLEKA
jgi:hypothetical protein